MFIRTIKMINERGDETIRQLLNVSASATRPPAPDMPPGGWPGPRAGELRRDYQAESIVAGALVGGQDLEPGRRRRREGHLEARAQIKLEPMIEFLADRQSALEADGKACQLIESGARAVLGPADGLSIEHAQSICDNLEIPYFELRPFLGGSLATPLPVGQPSRLDNELPAAAGQRRPPSALPLSSPAGAAQATTKLEDLTVNLYPPSHLLNSAYMDLIYALNWTSFAIVYEDETSMIRLQDLFKESSGSWRSRWRIKLFRYGLKAAHNSADTSEPEQVPLQEAGLERRPFLSPSGSSSSSGPTTTTRPASSQPQGEKPSLSFRDVFWRLKRTGEHNILLDVKTEHLYEALKQAQQVGCVTDEYSYLITSLDLHMIDLEDFKYSRTKITGLSLLQVAKMEQSVARGGRQASGGEADGELPSAASTSTNQPRPFFDERYLERLGVHMIRAGGSSQRRPSSSRPASGDSNEATYSDLTKREMLLSSPSSLGLLPTVDRINEQRLFDFLLELQERQLARVRLSTTSAILHDSLILYALALNELDPQGHLLLNMATTSGEQQQAPLCSLESQPWPHGSSLVNYMRQSRFTGLTGPIAFDQRGFRSDFKLDVVSLAPNVRLVKTGEWHSGQAVESRNRWAQFANGIDRTNSTSSVSQIKMEPNGSEETKSYEEMSKRYEVELKRYRKLLESGENIEVPYRKQISPNGALLVNEIIFERLHRSQIDQMDTLVVTAKLSQPYFMLKETPNKLEGNDRYEGYAVDLIHELSKLVNFNYKWREVADNNYGAFEVSSKNGTSKEWNGMIGEVVRGEADLAIVDLTITTRRQEAVDFTLPFMNTGISILFKKPTTKVTTLFSFLSPFSSDVWAYVLAAYCGISVILFLVGHLSPYEWSDPHPCRHLSNEDDTVLRNQFSLLNSFWFTIGSLMQQGSDLTPRSMSTRTIAGIWYFFTLIMISSYTANLAAFLTVERVVYPIENVRDLSNQQEIKYGCIVSGSTLMFFNDSQIDIHKKIYETMKKYETYASSNDEGVRRVGEGKYAFFMESTTIEYIVERNCNLTQIGGLIDSKGYGVAISKRPRHKRPYRTLLNEAILHLQETGMLHMLKNRWWKERRGGGTCTDDGKGGGVTELSLANVGGVFVVLLGGLGISFLVAIAEFMWRARRNGSTRDRMCEEMMNDLKFALACKRSTKPVYREPDGRRASRRSIRQQESLLSNDTDLDRVQAHMSSLEFNAKDCNPILLHAMLTMLAEQQQQQQQQQYLHHQQQPVLVPQDIARKLPFVVQQQQQQQQQYHAGPSDETSLLNKSMSIESSRFLPQNNNEPEVFWIKPTSKPANHQGQNDAMQPKPTRGANRKRLRSQRTIDIADDNITIQNDQLN